MSEIIHSINYSAEEQKTLMERLAPVVGIQKIRASLKSGDTIEGVIMEIGRDYLILIEGNFDVMIPSENIAYIRLLR